MVVWRSIYKQVLFILPGSSWASWGNRTTWSEGKPLLFIQYAYFIRVDMHTFYYIYNLWHVSCSWIVSGGSWYAWSPWTWWWKSKLSQCYNSYSIKLWFLYKVHSEDCLNTVSTKVGLLYLRGTKYVIYAYRSQILSKTNFDFSIQPTITVFPTAEETSVLSFCVNVKEEFKSLR